MVGTDTGQMAQGAQDAAKAGAAQQGAPGVFSMTVPFAKGSIAVQVRVTGESLKPAHLARVRKYLELAEADFGDDLE